MNERTGLRVIEVAALLGVAGDALVGQASGIGVNLPMWTAALAASAWCLDGAEAERRLSPVARRWLLPGALLFAALVAWRASGVLRALDFAVVSLLLALVVVERRGGSSGLGAGVVRVMREAARGAWRILTGFVPLVFRDVRWREITGRGLGRHGAGILRGLAIALPLVLFFGVLFMAADAVFSRLVNEAFAFDAGNIVMHVLYVLCFAWLAGGFLHGLLLAPAVNEFKLRRLLEPFRRLHGLLLAPAVNEGIALTQANGAAQPGEVAATTEGAMTKAATPFNFGMVETGIVLGLLNALFAAFVAVQLRYLFGGAGLVATTAGLTYAEYARRGFFELVLVAALVLPLLLAWHALLRASDRAVERLFRLLAGMLVGLLFVVMLSAVKRMMLYAGEYGLTELRVYTTAFMAWLGVTLLWFVVAALVRRERRKFACGALAAGLIVVFALHVINPDALIVRVNANRVAAKRVFDVEYALSLSDDAMPALAARLEQMTRYEQSLVARRLIEVQAASEQSDWRAWSVARARARRTFEADEGFWRALMGPSVVEVSRAGAPATP